MKGASAGGSVVVARTSDPAALAFWLTALEEAGIPAASYEEGIGAAVGGGSLPAFSAFAVVVPRSMLAEARTVIAECGGAGALAAVPGTGLSPLVRWATLVVLGSVAAAVGAAVAVRLL
ncbi:hypothetical protein HRbin29_02166 [bacterium HR29]|jgi:hypothetical protein|nr:hypothetical protein HRbin29_02166 [bacterium HR29]